jgi:hypothetical protein
LPECNRLGMRSLVGDGDNECFNSCLFRVLATGACGRVLSSSAAGETDAARSSAWSDVDGTEADEDVGDVAGWFAGELMVVVFDGRRRQDLGGAQDVKTGRYRRGRS